MSKKKYTDKEIKDFINYLSNRENSFRIISKKGKVLITGGLDSVYVGHNGTSLVRTSNIEIKTLIK